MDGLETVTSATENVTSIECISEEFISTKVFRVTVISCLGALLLLAIVTCCQRCWRKSGQGNGTRPNSFADPSYEDLPVSFKSSTLTPEQKERQSSTKTRDRYSLATLLADNDKVDPMTEHRIELHNRMFDGSQHKQQHSAMKREMNEKPNRMERSKTLPFNSSNSPDSSTYLLASNEPEPAGHINQCRCCGPNGSGSRKPVQIRQLAPVNRFSVLNKLKNRWSRPPLGHGLTGLEGNTERGMNRTGHRDRIYSQEYVRPTNRPSIYNNTCCGQCKCDIDSRRHHHAGESDYVTQDVVQDVTQGTFEGEQEDMTSWQGNEEGPSHGYQRRNHEEDTMSNDKPEGNKNARDQRLDYDDVANTNMDDQWSHQHQPKDVVPERYTDHPLKHNMKRRSQSSEDILAMVMKQSYNQKFRRNEMSNDDKYENIGAKGKDSKWTKVNNSISDALDGRNESTPPTSAARKNPPPTPIRQYKTLPLPPPPQKTRTMDDQMLDTPLPPPPQMCRPKDENAPLPPKPKEYRPKDNTMYRKQPY